MHETWQEIKNELMWIWTLTGIPGWWRKRHPGNPVDGQSHDGLA